jgi:hypothetical protein
MSVITAIIDLGSIFALSVSDICIQTCCPRVDFWNFMFWPVLVHHQEFYFVWHAGLTKCAVVWRGIRYYVL